MTLSSTTIRVASLCAALALCGALACEDPFVLIPGGALEGTVRPAPGNWDFTHEVDTIQFETNPTEPYSVNIWIQGVGDKLYVHAGANRATWIGNMEKDPRARVRVGEDIYELSASRVTEQAEFDTFANAYEDKYGTRPRNENVDEAYLFRLVAR